MLVVLRLDHGKWQVGLVVKDEVGSAGLTTAVQLSSDDDTTLGKADLLAYLLVHVPAGQLNSWRDVLAADVSLGQRFLIHYPNSLSNRPGLSSPAPLIALYGRKCTLFGFNRVARCGILVPEE